ncbi:cyanophycinase [Gemmata sp.]|uniref:cyanophycinase n=1 Tax=Gemmata sp. TaxID=1914242 RepID=UPI003F7071F6
MAGTLVIIGGHEDREGEKAILREVAGRAGGKRVVVVTTASEEPDDLMEVYTKAFGDLGVKDVVQVHQNNREDGLSEEAAEPLKRAGAVFFTGGDQLRLTSQLGDTPVFQAIQKVYQDGGVVAGTSAGASALSDTMLVSGESGSSPRAGDANRMAPGFGLVEGLVIDQHFAERGRTGRLLAAIAQNPKSLGLGIDEDTAVVVERQRFKVVGSGGVYVFDASKVTYSTVADAAEEEPLSIHDAVVHVLAPGDTFDLKQRRPVRSSAKKE